MRKTRKPPRPSSGKNPTTSGDQGYDLHGFDLHPDAASDITHIWEFIAEDNVGAAKRVREDILDAIRGLVRFPHQGHRRTDLTSRPLRFQTVRNYLIAYSPDEKPLPVIAVVDGRRNPRVIAAILRERK